MKSSQCPLRSQRLLKCETQCTWWRFSLLESKSPPLALAWCLRHRSRERAIQWALLALGRPLSFPNLTLSGWTDGAESSGPKIPSFLQQPPHLQSRTQLFLFKAVVSHSSIFVPHWKKIASCNLNDHFVKIRWVFPENNVLQPFFVKPGFRDEMIESPLKGRSRREAEPSGPPGSWSGVYAN